MSAVTATFDELQGRNYAVLSKTHLIKSAFAELSKHARKHADIILGLGRISSNRKKQLKFQTIEGIEIYSIWMVQFFEQVDLSDFIVQTRFSGSSESARRMRRPTGNTTVTTIAAAITNAMPEGPCVQKPIT